MSRIIHSLPGRAQFDGRDWEVYKTVNERFADVTVTEAGDAGFVWIQDYQLMLTATKVRRELPEARIGFFLHVPFPPYDIFRLLPWDREMLRGMLAADLIGFHVRSYAWNFYDCVERSLGARVNRQDGVVEYGDRATQVGALPSSFSIRRARAIALRLRSEFRFPMFLNAQFTAFFT